MGQRMILADMMGLAPTDFGIFCGCLVTLGGIVYLVTGIIVNVKRMKPHNNEHSPNLTTIDPDKEFVTRGEYRRDLDVIRNDHKSNISELKTEMDRMGDKITNMALDVRELVTLKRIECKNEIQKP